VTRDIRIAPVAAVLSILIGATVLVGWATRTEILTGLIPGVIIMIPNSAVGFIVSGVSLGLSCLSARTNRPFRTRPIGIGLALFPLMLGALTFLERLAGFDFGIDLILFAEDVKRYPYLPPGQMAINSTVCFMLAGAALLVLDHRTAGGKRPGQWLAMLGIVVSSVALVGHLYGARWLYAFDRAAGMAPLTAISFLILHSGILLARPREGGIGIVTGNDLGGTMLRRLLPALIVVPVSLGWLWIQVREVGLASREGAVSLFVVIVMGVLITLLVQSARLLRDMDRSRQVLLEREQEARAEAEAASKVKSNFLATMSHELRTPLNAVIGYTSLLLDGITGPLKDEQRKQLGRIEVSARHLLTLIEEILTLSRLEAGKETIATERVDVDHVLTEAAMIIEPLASMKGLEFRIQRPEESIEIHTDAGKLRQILVNLLSNAVKFTEQGEISLAASADGNVVLFRVRDTGIGISGENIEKIFEPFWQVEAHTTRRAPGTGLGLSVSRRLATLLGGELSVRSNVGEGSTFVLVMPKGEARIESPIRAQDSDRHAAALPPSSDAVT
jgi:signal transduction histidine kinase